MLRLRNTKKTTMIDFIQRYKLMAGLSLGLAGIGVFALWQEDDRIITESGAGAARPSRTTHSGRLSGASGKHGFNHSTIDDTSKKEPRQTRGLTRQIARANDVDEEIISRSEEDKQSWLRKGKKKSPAPIPSRLALILGDTTLSARERVKIIESLTGSYDEEDRQSAYDFLKSAKSPEGMAKGQWRWLVDETMTSLRKEGGDNAGLSQHLAGIYRNQSQDPVIRDYTLQHLGHIRSVGGDREAIDQNLFAATSEKEGTLAGTALVAMLHGGGVEEGQSDAISQAALKVVSNNEVDLRSRISAMQVLGKLGNTESLPIAVEIAGNENLSVPLRMAAIATIGDLKASEHTSLLQVLSGSNDPRLRNSALATLKTFD